jgi:hypothetical protein
MRGQEAVCLGMGKRGDWSLTPHGKGKPTRVGLDSANERREK